MIPVFSPKLSISDILTVLSAMFKNEISGTSSVVKNFENKLAKFFDRKYAIATSNGSVSLDVSFKLLNLEKNSEVILPSFTIISCLSAVIRAGLKPVFCDVDFNTWNMTLDSVKKVYSKNTRAVLIVHTYGLTGEVNEIVEFCREKKLKIIEDAAEAHGQTIGKTKCGSIGDISTLSFYANKHITTGEGGAILTDDLEIYNMAKKMINLDFDNNNRFKHDNLYWNYRMGGLQAALGASQLKQVNKVIKNKIKQGENYIKLFKKHEIDVQLPLLSTQYSVNHFWVFGIVLNKKSNRNQITNELEKAKIQTRPFFYPLHKQPAIAKKNSNKDILLNSEILGERGFYIPLGKHITKSKQEKVVLEIKRIIG
tara:strand:- start:18260 stop:19363 length:1104 start_codon:yes stop_codon:yes gene_type:complete